MRKSGILLLSLALILCLSLPAMAAQVYVDGQELDVSTAVENGTTLVPLRAIFQSLGASVDWDGNTQTVTANKGQITVKLQIGSDTAYKNGQVVPLRVPGKIINGSTMVPLRFVSESLGAKVDWDGATQTITITSGTISAPTQTDNQVPLSNPTKVHFIDVGQADSIYIELAENQDILIDGGNRSDGATVVSYLKNNDVDDIELLIATHPHEDHIGGLPDVLDAYKVEKIVDSGYFTDSKISSTYRSKTKAEGAVYNEDNHSTYIFGDVSLQVLTGAETWEDTNDYSVVCRLDTGDIEFMFTGDAEAPVEAILSGELEAEILKVGHHGSSSSTSQAFLNKVDPEVAVISVGADNRYGHPTPKTLQELKDDGIKIYRTDLNGNVIVTTNGKTYSVRTQRNDTAPVVQPTESGSKPEPSSAPIKTDTNADISIENISLDDEIVTIKNNSASNVDLTGWYIVSEKGSQTYYFPNGYTLTSGSTVYITSGRGAKDSAPKYLKWTGSYIWNNDGDPGALYNANGQVVSQWP
ncbi:MAG: MBL fold metallo-hydrolase [Firmicutes bacterium]|nr:MBL fold metallo-hydrolase [Bacillota bacterium]